MSASLTVIPSATLDWLSTEVERRGYARCEILGARQCETGKYELQVEAFEQLGSKAGHGRRLILYAPAVCSEGCPR